MYHVGRKIKEVWSQSGLKVGYLAIKLDINPRTWYDIIEKEHISTKMLLKICDLLKYNFFLDLSKEVGFDDFRENALSEPPTVYLPSNSKYIELLEKYTECLEQNRKLSEPKK